MSTTWRWIFGIVFGLAILGLLGYSGSSRQAYRNRQGGRSKFIPGYYLEVGEINRPDKRHDPYQF